MCIFSLASVFSATIAWFISTQQRLEDSDSMEMTAFPGAFQKVTFHKSIGSYQYYVVGDINGASWSTYNDIYGLEKVTAQQDGKDLYVSNIITLRTSNAFKVRIVGSTGDNGYFGGDSNATVASEGQYVVSFCPDGGVSSWSDNGGYFNVTSVSDSDYRYNFNGNKRLLSEINPSNANERTLVGLKMSKGDTISFGDANNTFGFDNLKTDSPAYSSFGPAGSKLICKTSGVYDFYYDITASTDDPAISVSVGATTNYENNYYFEETPTETLTYNWETNTVQREKNASINLGLYSILDKNHPMLCVFHFKETSDFIDIKVTTPNSFLGNVANEDLKSSGNPLSSIVKFSAKLGTEVDSDGHYIYSKNRLNDNFSSFAQITNNVPDFPAAVDGVYSTQLWNAALNGENTLSLAIDYYPELIEYIYGHFIGNPLLSGENTLSFTCDWRWIIQ